MFEWVKSIFGAPSVVSTVADGVKTGFTMLDKAFYTDQEKSETGIKFMEIWLKLQMMLANDNSVSALTRRIIAFLMYSLFCFLVTFACLVWKWDKAWAEFILKVIVDMQIGWIVVTITVFFFGLYGIGKYISKDNMPYSTEAIDNPKPREEKKDEPQAGQ